MKSMNYATQRKLVIIGFLLLPLLLLGTFIYYPAANLLVTSFTDWDGFSQSRNWVGFDQYKEVFSNPEIFGVFAHNIAYFIGGIVQNIIALVFAVMLNTKLKGRNAFRIILFLPFVMNSVAISYMFKFFYDTTGGSLNMLLMNLGIIEEGISWLGNGNLVNWSLSFVGLWKFMGYNMIIYLGALQSLPSDMYEAASIDGAGPWRTFWNITLPNLKTIIELNMFLTITGALETFDIPFVLTEGGPMGQSVTFAMKTTDTAFQFNNYGLASAMSIILLVLVASVVGIQRYFLNRGES